jgi:hypothetical protein
VAKKIKRFGKQVFGKVIQEMETKKLEEATAKVVESPPRQKIRAREPLDRGCKGEYYFGVGEEIFWVGQK